MDQKASVGGLRNQTIRLAAQAASGGGWRQGLPDQPSESGTVVYNPQSDVVSTLPAALITW